MTKLSEITGYEQNWPKKEPEYGGTHADVQMAIGGNKVIDQTSSLGIGIDENKIWEEVGHIDYNINDYEMRGDNGDYTPNEQEKILMEDYLNGFLEQFVKAIAANPKAFLRIEKE